MRPDLTSALRSVVPAVLAGALVAGAALVAPGAAAEQPPDPERGTFWFGPDLKWTNDSVEDYNLRLGADGSLFGRSVGYPLNETSELLLRDLSSQTSEAGAVGVVTMEPANLVRLTDADAEEFAQTVASVTEDDGSFLLLRFAPEMNGSWTSWGRRPLTYVKAFRSLADAVHDATDAALMLWSPAYGAGYPFDSAINSTTGPGEGAPEFDERNVPYLDTDGDGEITDSDDPYGPYYPGDDYVDWVGLTMLRYGLRQEFGDNTRPARGELDARFMERLGYADDGPRRTFYVRFAGRKEQPFLLSTAAMYNPRRGGAREVELKRRWLEQVADAVPSRPMLRGVLWLEQSRVEPEIGGVVSWQITDDPELASVSRAVLDQGAAAFGPLDGIGDSENDDDRDEDGDDDENSTASPTADSETNDEASGPEGSGLSPFVGGVLVTLVLVLVAGVTALRIRRRRMIPPWLR